MRLLLAALVGVAFPVIATATTASGISTFLNFCIANSSTQSWFAGVKNELTVTYNSTVYCLDVDVRGQGREGVGSARAPLLLLLLWWWRYVYMYVYV